MMMILYIELDKSILNQVKPYKANFEQVDPVSSRLQELTEEERSEYLKSVEEEKNVKEVIE